jgi:hypothetical protein
MNTTHAPTDQQQEENTGQLRFNSIISNQTTAHSSMVYIIMFHHQLKPTATCSNDHTINQHPCPNATNNSM